MNTYLDGDGCRQFQLDQRMVSAARNRLRSVILSTPLLQSKRDPEIYFKAENLQVTGSFKIRAAFNEIHSLSESQRKKGIVTSSSGNFAQSVAYAARRFETSAKVVMMESADPLKIAATRRFGAEVVFCENRFEAREEMVQRIQEQEGRVPIHPFDHPAVIAGNATIGFEIMEQLPDVENVVVPVSGGGLIAGVASAIKLKRLRVQTWGVQPEKSNAAYQSFRMNRRVSIEQPVTIADGLMVARPGKVTFPLIQESVDEMLVVREDSILAAIRSLLLDEKLVVEPSGAVTLAALLEEKVPLNKTVCLLSGGNIRPEVLSAFLGSGPPQ